MLKLIFGLWGVSTLILITGFALADLAVFSLGMAGLLVSVLIAWKNKQ